MAEQTPQPEIRTFAETLRELMDERGLSSSELGRRIGGGGRRHVRRLLKGETVNPLRETRLRVARALEVDPERLLTARSPEDVALARLDQLEERLTRVEQLLGVLEGEIRYVLGERPRLRDAAP